MVSAAFQRSWIAGKGSRSDAGTGDLWDSISRAGLRVDQVLPSAGLSH